MDPNVFKTDNGISWEAATDCGKSKPRPALSQNGLVPFSSPEFPALISLLPEMIESLVSEICQPLVSISANASASLRWIQKPSGRLDDVVNGLENVRTDAERVANVVKLLQKVARLATGQSERVALHDAVEDALALSMPEISRRRIQLQTSISRSCYLTAPAAYLQFVLCTIIISTLKSIPEDMAESTVLRLSGVVVGGQIELCVAASTASSTATECQRAVSEFECTDRWGPGMDFTVCKLIMSALGGSVRLEPASFNGSHFRLHFLVDSD